MNSRDLLDGPVETKVPAEKIASVDSKVAKAFAYARDFMDNRFVYLTISPRARGLSIGVNINPDRDCNFDCVYCEVNRALPVKDAVIDCDVASTELENMLTRVHQDRLRQLHPYSGLPLELLKLRHVALSGDGEPTISPKFLDTVEMVVHLRARGGFPFFKIVLITNGSALDRPEVQAALKLFTARDEIWSKLDAGSQRGMDVVNRATVPCEKIVDNLLQTARQRPVIVQSLFCQVDGAVPSNAEIEEFATQLRDLKEKGAQIPLVQIYSATRPTPNSNVRHLPLRFLSDIAESVRRIAGLNAEPF